MKNASGLREINNPGRQYFPTKTVRIGISGPVVAELRPFEERDSLGVEISTTENLEWSQNVTDKVSKEFHNLVGGMLEQYENRKRAQYVKGKSKQKAFPYTGSFYLIPTDDGASVLSLVATTYSQGRIDSLAETAGKDVFYTTRFQNVMEWAGRHPGWAKTIKWGFILGGIAATACFAIGCTNHLADAAAQQGIMNNNLRFFQDYSLIREGIITPADPAYNQIMTGYNNYLAAQATRNLAMSAAVTDGAIAGASGGAAGTAIFHPLKTKGQKVKLSAADKEIGKYLQNQGMYKVLPVNAELKQYTPLFQK